MLAVKLERDERAQFDSLGRLIDDDHLELQGVQVIVASAGQGSADDIGFSKDSRMSSSHLISPFLPLPLPFPPLFFRSLLRLSTFLFPLLFQVLFES